MSKITERINWIDTAKAIGIFLIVLSHTLENGLFRQAIFSFHVTLFFFLSGLTYHGLKRGVWRKRFFRLYLPYIIFSVVSILILAFASRLLPELKNVSVGLIKGLLGMLYGNARTGYMKWNEPLWFIPCLIAVYALADITEIGLSKLNASLRSGGGGIVSKNSFRIGIAIVFLAISYFLGKFKRTVMLPFGLESAFFVFIFFQIGVLINHQGATSRVGKIRNNRLLMAVISVIMIVVIGIISRYNGFAQVKTVSFGRSIFLFLGTSVLGITTVVIISVMADRIRWLQYIGQHTLPILLMHKFPILFFQMIIKPVGKLLEQGNSVVGITCAVIVGAISVGLCLIANLIIEKILPIVVGKIQTE